MKKGFYVAFSFKKLILMSVTFILFFSCVMMLGYCSVNSQMALSEAALPVIIIDAGHGGEDGGTQSAKGYLEKDINLAVSLLIDEKLKEKGFSTVLIRDGDYLIYDESSSTMREKKASDIHNRMNIMNQYSNCIFLSIHQNYFTESKYSGAQVFYSKNNPESEKLASKIQSSIVESLQPDNTRQIKASGTEIYLLYHAEAPAVMVECGFLSNEAEAEKLINEEYQDKLADAIITGLINHLEVQQIQNEGETENGV